MIPSYMDDNMILDALHMLQEDICVNSLVNLEKQWISEEGSKQMHYAKSWGRWSFDNGEN